MIIELVGKKNITRLFRTIEPSFLEFSSKRSDMRAQIKEHPYLFTKRELSFAKTDFRRDV